jgi:hypothetical protein
MRTINYTQDMAESTNTLFVNNAMSTGRENGLNKAYLYGKQAQVQYINLEWTNEIGKKMWHKAYTVVPSPQVKQWGTNFILTMQTFSI